MSKLSVVDAEKAPVIERVSLFVGIGSITN